MRSLLEIFCLRKASPLCFSIRQLKNVLFVFLVLIGFLALPRVLFWSFRTSVSERLFASLKNHPEISVTTGKALSVSGWLLPVFVFQDVKIALTHLSPGKSPVFLETKRMEIKLSLQDLLKGKFTGETLTFSKTNLFLVRDLKADVNWQKDPLGVLFSSYRSLFFEGLDVTWQNAPHAHKQEIELVEAEVQRKTPEDRLELLGTWKIRGEYIKTRGYLASLSRFFQEKSAFELFFASRFFNATFSGHTGIQKDWHGAGQFAFSTSSLRALTPWVNVPFPFALPEEEATLEGRAEWQTGRTILKDISFVSPKSRASGSARFDFQDLIPHVSVDVSIPTLQIPKAVHLSEEKEIPILFSPHMILNFSASIERFQYSDFQQVPLKIKAFLNDKTADLDLSSHDTHGGQARGRFVLSPVAQGTSLQAAVRLENFLPEKENIFRDGFFLSKVTGYFSLATFGETIQEWRSRLYGTGEVTHLEGEINNTDFAKFLNRLKQGAFVGWPDFPGGHEAFTLSSGALTLEDGLLKAKNTYVNKTTCAIKVRGEADLLRERLEMFFIPPSQTPCFTSEFSGSQHKVKLEGPLAFPVFSLQKLTADDITERDQQTIPRDGKMSEQDPLRDLFLALPKEDKPNN